MSKLTHAHLLELLHYDPMTGIFTSRVDRGARCRVGSQVGSLTKTYVQIRINYEMHYAHRLAVFYMSGEWPKEEVDHINGIKTDNRFSNLRTCSSSQNKQNLRAPKRHNSSGFLGVSLCSKTGKWRAYIGLKGKTKALGSYDDPESAHAAYVQAKRDIHSFNTL